MTYKKSWDLRAVDLVRLSNTADKMSEHFHKDVTLHDLLVAIDDDVIKFPPTTEDLSKWISTKC